MSYMIDNHSLAFAVIVSLLGVVIIFAIAFGIAIPLGIMECNQYITMNPQRQYTYNVVTGCMILDDNGLWIPYRQYIGISK